MVKAIRITKEFILIPLIFVVLKGGGSIKLGKLRRGVSCGVDDVKGRSPEEGEPTISR